MLTKLALPDRNYAEGGVAAEKLYVQAEHGTRPVNLFHQRKVLRKVSEIATRACAWRDEPSVTGCVTTRC